MALIPSWEAQSSSALQETLRIWSKSAVSHPVYNGPPFIPILSHMNHSIPSHPISVRSVLVLLPSHLRLVFQVISLFQVSLTKALYVILLSSSRSIWVAHPCCDCPNNIFSMVIFFLKSSPICNSSLRRCCCTIAVALRSAAVAFYSCIDVPLLSVANIWMKFHWRWIANVLDTEFPMTHLLCILN